MTSAAFEQGGGPVMLGILWTFGAIAIFMMCFRLYSRVFYTDTKFGWDDIVIAFCIPYKMVYLVLATLSIHYGMGQHINTISKPNLVQALKIGTVATDVAAMFFALPKLAVVLLMNRVLGLSVAAKFAFFGGLALLESIAVAAVVVGSVKCTPRSAVWNVFQPHTCWNPLISTSLAVTLSAFSAFLDLMIAVYPVVRIYNLRMKRSKKITASLIMGSGALALVFAVAKIPFLGLGNIGNENSTDFTYNGTPAVILSEIEIDVLLVTASLSTIGGLLTRIKNRKTSQTSSDESTEQRYKATISKFGSSTKLGSDDSRKEVMEIYRDMWRDGSSSTAQGSSDAWRNGSSSTRNGSESRIFKTVTMSVEHKENSQLDTDAQGVGSPDYYLHQV